MVSESGQDVRRLRTLWPLPGGSGHYVTSLKRMLALAEEPVSVREYVSAVVRRFSGVTSSKAAASYARVVSSLGLIEFASGRVRLMPAGRKYLESEDVRILQRALINRIDGVSELLDELDVEPARIGLLLPRMQERDFEWKTASQLRYRLRWLEELGMVQSAGAARAVYSLTPAGRRYL